MVVELIKDIFENEKTLDERHLDRLWNVIENRHRLLLRKDEDIEALMESNWYAHQRESIKEIIWELMLWSIHPFRLFQFYSILFALISVCKRLQTFTNIYKRN